MMFLSSLNSILVKQASVEFLVTDNCGSILLEARALSYYLKDRGALSNPAKLSYASVMTSDRHTNNTNQKMSGLTMEHNQLLSTPKFGSSCTLPSKVSDETFTAQNL